MIRAEAIERYRHLRAVSKAHFDKSLNFVSKPSLMDYARRLGVVIQNTIILDDVDDFAYIYDLALFTAKDGRSRAIDRYARSIHPDPGSDEELMLRAAQAARFAVCAVEGRHETAGLNIRDLARKQTLRLMDEGFEATMPAGVLFASRLKPVDDYVMTTGAAVPLDRFEMEDILSNPLFSTKSSAMTLGDYRFQIAIFRAYLTRQTGTRIEHRDSWESPETEAA